VVRCPHTTATHSRHSNPSIPLQVALLDKEHFPRDKYCGDAVCTPAINILREMGVLKELQDNNEAHFADNGGFVSPSGISYIGDCLSPALMACLVRAPGACGQGLEGQRVVDW